MSDYVLAKASTWVEGETQAKDLIFSLSTAITSAVLPLDSAGAAVPNKWTEVFRDTEDKWVTYKEKYRDNVQGKYLHTDGKLYDVIKVAQDWSDVSAYIDAEGFIYEVRGYDNIRTGRKIQVVSFTTTDSMGNPLVLNVPGLLMVGVDDLNTASGKKVLVVEQKRTNLDNTITVNTEWNEFKYLCDVPATAGDWDIFLDSAITYNNGYNKVTSSNFLFRERYYEAEVLNESRSLVVLKATPDVPTGITPTDYYVVFEQPLDDYNYIDVYYGLGFSGTVKAGDSKLTYEGICDPLTVKSGIAPTIINQLKAEDVYKKQISNTPYFTPTTIDWQKDYDGVTKIVSPPYHFFHGCDSTLSWVINKRRKPYYLVKYFISVNNDRIALVLEGDPTPSIADYYRSFGYIGKIVPFNSYDHTGNFGITVGMGDPDIAKTRMTVDDIKEMTNPQYAGWGEYTSNGMYSMSMMLTRSSVFFQSYYPSFLTQLPNYPSVGTIPPELQRLVLDKNGFQSSLWTNKYHASPIYLVHKAEGYRGFLDGVVAIYNHNLVNLDELVVDTGVLKDSLDPSKGNIIEVYKFFSLISPVNFFKYSASPDMTTVAILKEIK